MGTKALSFFTLALSVATTAFIIVVTAMGEAMPYKLDIIPQITCCMAMGAITLLALRFNITALRHDMTERMIIPNTGLILVSMYMIYLGIRHFTAVPDIANYIVLGGLVCLFIIVFVVYWAFRRRFY